MRSIQTTELFDAWFAGLKDRQARVRIDRAERGNFGDVKPVAEGVSEMRIDHGPAIGCISPRVDWNWSSQVKDIKTALQLAREL